ncbi:MAG: hypothetical protein Q9220_004855 [cf. Caloplaca sp. 1 TL-2023]
MPFFEPSPPPNKRRKVTTTYGSHGMFSRALRAVKDAVPGNLLSFDDSEVSRIPTTAYGTGIETKDHWGSQEKANGSDPIPPNIDTQSPIEAASDDETCDSNGGQDHSSGDLNPVPRSKAAKGTVYSGNHSGSPQNSKKRRRVTAPSAAEEAEGLRDTNLEPKASTIRKRRERDLVPTDKNITTRAKGSEPINAQETNSPTDGDGTNAQHERSSGRLRRKPKRFSIDNHEPSPSRPAPKKTRTPKSAPGTPGRKRGRPRKHPIPADLEENELGCTNTSINNGDTVYDTTEAALDEHPDLSSDNSATRQPPLSVVNEQVKNQPSRGTSWNPVRSAQNGRGSKGSSPAQAYEDPMSQQRREDEDENAINDIIYDGMQQPIAQLQRRLESSSVNVLDSFKSNLIKSLTGKQHRLVEMKEEHHKLHHVVAQTILAGEGNSMLITGPRGCGKTTLVESVLAELAHEHQHDFLVVRLNGFIHTDDKLALREIWRQLGRELAAEDEVTGIRTNYADTLTSLLALLSHSSSEDEGQQDEIARSVVFTIDEFDLFASHPRQTLLYNLFDVAQSRNAPIAVLGLTTRIDVVESLEKRVKSRFGQRYIHLGHPKTFQTFEAICRSKLIVDGPISIPFAERLKAEDAALQKLRTAWDEYIEALFAHDKYFHTFLQRLWARSKSVSSFLSASLVPINLLTPSYVPNGQSFIEHALLPPDSKLQLLPSLSDLELSLLISAARLDVILDTDVCNFAMAYDGYVQLASRVKMQSSAAGQTAVGGGLRVWGKEVAIGAWERLVELEVILPANLGLRGSARSHMCRVDVALEEIEGSVPLMSSTMIKWCKEI